MGVGMPTWCSVECVGRGRAAMSHMVRPAGRPFPPEWPAAQADQASSTSGWPPTTCSPSATSTAVTVAS